MLRLVVVAGFILIAVGILVFERRDLYSKVTPLNTKRTFIRRGSKIKLTPNLVIEMFETSTMRMVRQMGRRTLRARSVASQTATSMVILKRSSLPRHRRRGRCSAGPGGRRRRHSFDQYYYDLHHLLRNCQTVGRVSKRGGRHKTCVYAKCIVQQTKLKRASLLSVSCPQIENIE